MGVFFRLALKRPELAPGRDPQELYNQYLVVEFLKYLLTQMRGITRKAEDTVLSGMADLWKAVLHIYRVAQHLPPGTGLNQELVDAVNQMNKAASTGHHK